MLTYACKFMRWRPSALLRLEQTRTEDKQHAGATCILLHGVCHSHASRRIVALSMLPRRLHSQRALCNGTGACSACVMSARPHNTYAGEEGLQTHISIYGLAQQLNMAEVIPSACGTTV